MTLLNTIFFINLLQHHFFIVMPRHARQRSTTNLYHVMLRGINRMVIFSENDDRQMFLNLLQHQIAEDFKVYCYCLMDNHIHLLLESPALSEHIRRIATSYAMWFNNKYGRCGHLFQDRFKSEIIETEDYLLQCFRYILQNPVKAGICQYSSQYRWNSYACYYSPNNTFISGKFLYAFFDSKKDMDEFLSEENSTQFIDIPQITKHSDQEIKVLLETELNGKIFQALEKKLQKQILRKIIEITGVGPEQLAKITGISAGVIRHIKY